MTIEATLRAAIVPLCAQVFPDFAPPGTAAPYVVYQQVGGQVADLLEGGPALKRNARMQVIAWADTRLQAAELMRQIDDVLRSAPLYAEPLGDQIARADPAVQLRGAQQDFSLWW